MHILKFCQSAVATRFANWCSIIHCGVRNITTRTVCDENSQNCTTLVFWLGQRRKTSIDSTTLDALCFDFVDAGRSYWDFPRATLTVPLTSFFFLYTFRQQQNHCCCRNASFLDAYHSESSCVTLPPASFIDNFKWAWLLFFKIETCFRISVLFIIPVQYADR